MSNLLQVSRLGSEALKGKGAVPLIVEFKIDPLARPFLVSSTAGLLWVEEAHPGDVVKAAVRRDATPGDLFWGVIKSVVERGKAEEWGNSFPFTPAGVNGAVEYVRSFDIDDLEIIIPLLREDGKKKGKSSGRPGWLRPDTFKLPCRPSSWLPPGCAVVAPRDKNFVGIIGHLDAKAVVVCVHNPSRGLAIAWDGPAKAPSPKRKPRE